MWLAIKAALSLIPGIGNFIVNAEKVFFDAKVRLVSIRTGADVNIATQLIQGQAQADARNVQRLSIFASNKILMFILVGFAIPIVFWFNKAVAYDKIICVWIWGTTCSTDELKGEVLEITRTVIYFLFGTPAVMGLGKMGMAWFSRAKTGE